LPLHFLIAPTREKNIRFCFLEEPWGQPVTQEAGSVPESLRLWVGGKSVKYHLLLALTVVATMSITRTEGQALNLVEQV